MTRWLFLFFLVDMASALRRGGAPPAADTLLLGFAFVVRRSCFDFKCGTALSSSCISDVERMICVDGVTDGFDRTLFFFQLEVKSISSSELSPAPRDEEAFKNELETAPNAAR
jgi:hypothetical protein